MTNLSILSKEIRILDGLYSLNDLHKASGYSNKHRPSLFMKNQQTQELIHEIEQSRNSCFGENNQSENSHFEKNRDLGIPRSVKTQRGGAYSGTWVCKELVYAYAMWISPKFHLQVIRAFDAMANQEPQLLPHQMLQLEYDKNFCINKQDLSNLIWLWFASERMRLLLKKVSKPLMALGARDAVEIRDHYVEYKRTVASARSILMELSTDLNIDDEKILSLSHVLPCMKINDVGHV